MESTYSNHYRSKNTPPPFCHFVPSRYSLNGIHLTKTFLSLLIDKPNHIHTMHVETPFSQTQSYSELVFSQLNRHLLTQSRWHRKLTITAKTTFKQYMDFRRLFVNPGNLAHGYPFCLISLEILGIFLHYQASGLKLWRNVNMFFLWDVQSLEREALIKDLELARPGQHSWYLYNSISTHLSQGTSRKKRQILRTRELKCLPRDTAFCTWQRVASIKSQKYGHQNKTWIMTTSWHVNLIRKSHNGPPLEELHTTDGGSQRKNQSSLGTSLWSFIQSWAIRPKHLHMSIVYVAFATLPKLQEWAVLPASTQFPLECTYKRHTLICSISTSLLTQLLGTYHLPGKACPYQYS